MAEVSFTNELEGETVRDSEASLDGEASKREGLGEEEGSRTGSAVIVGEWDLEEVLV